MFYKAHRLLKALGQRSLQLNPKRAGINQWNLWYTDGSNQTQEGVYQRRWGGRDILVYTGRNNAVRKELAKLAEEYRCSYRCTKGEITNSEVVVVRDGKQKKERIRPPGIFEHLLRDD